MANFNVRNTVSSIISKRDHLERSFRFIISKLHCLYDGALHRDVDAVETSCDAIHREGRDMMQNVEGLLLELRSLYNFDCAAGSDYCEEVRDDTFGHDWAEEMRIFYMAADELNHWLCQALAENNERAKQLIEECFELFNRTFSILEELTHGGSFDRVDICYPTPIYINITNMETTEKHLHFHDNSSYIEHQEIHQNITVQSGANFYNGFGGSNVKEEEKQLPSRPSPASQHTTTVPTVLSELMVKAAVFVKPDCKERYLAFWKNVLNHPDFVSLFQKSVPNGFRGGYNKKLFCNILGFLQERGFFTIPNKQLDGSFVKTIDGKTGAKYLNNFMPEKDGRPSSDTELTPTLIPVLVSYAE